MKVVHITSFDDGGAGTAAIRVHKALLKAGVKSKVLCLRKRTNNSDIIPIISTRSLFDRFLSRLGVRTQDQILKEKIQRNIGKAEHFSLLTSDSKVHMHDELKSADIIHLHWISGMVDYVKFFETVRKPIVWTIHDMNPFLGIFHYENDLNCDNDLLTNYEHRFRSIKKKILQRNKNIFPIFLSSWMIKKSQKYNFALESVKKIPNCVDFDSFRFLDKSICRNIFNLPINRKIVLFVAEKITNKRKGFQRIIDLIETTIKLDDVLFVGVGKAINSEFTDSRHIMYIDQIQDERLLNVLYNACDLLLIPSIEDNLPNTMLEALAVGLPVLAYDNGGMKEYIRDGFNGLILSNSNGKNLMSAILEICENSHSYDRLSIRQNAYSHFSEKTIASKFITYYNSLL